MFWNTQAGSDVELKPSVLAQKLAFPDPGCGTYRSIRWVPEGWVTPTSNGQYVIPPSVTWPQLAYIVLRSLMVKLLAVVMAVGTGVAVTEP